MAISFPRARMLPAAALLTAFVMGAGTLPITAANDPRRDPLPVRNFLIGLGCWESGGRYDLRHPVSRAYGKYQILPGNWPSWAREYIGRGDARQTPRNQEIVARGKVMDLYRWRGNWERVALWWLTGSRENDPRRWSDMATRFVRGVLSLAQRSRTAAGRATMPSTCLSRPAGRGSGPAEDPPRPQPPAPRPDPEPRRVRVVTAYILNLRSGPGRRHDVVWGVWRGERVRVLATREDGRGRDWYRIRLGNGYSGWIASWWTERP